MTSPGTLACWMYDWYIVYIKPMCDLNTVLDDRDQCDKCHCLNKFKQDKLALILRKV